MSETADIPAPVGWGPECLGCGAWVPQRHDDYCPSCWMDVLDWLGW